MKFFKKRAVLIFFGLLLLSLFIWFAGPVLRVRRLQAARAVLARLIAILLLFVIWGLVALVEVDRRAPRRREARAGGRRECGAGRERDGRANRCSCASASRRPSRRSRKPRSEGKSLYDLPWYVIIGPPGSGKTTVLVNSGLKFPLEQRFGKEALRGVGGTRNCDWWFTDEAVLLDTAGRYTTQDSDASADSAGWAEFLNLLTKYRKRRPLNGVIVTLSAAGFDDPEPQPEREANVAAVRRRLDELNRNLKVRLPIYVLVTKCDLIAGFSEYFDDLDAVGRSQVWGMTFAPERSIAGSARRGFPARIRCADRAAQPAPVRARRGGARRAPAHGRVRVPAADRGNAQSASARSSPRCSRRHASTAGCCCAACTSRAARRKARRSIGS